MTIHKHARDDWLDADGVAWPTKCVDIDEHVCLHPIVHSSAPKGVVLNTPEADAYGTHPSGYILGHDRPGFDVRCEGHVTVDDCDGRPTWTQTGTLEGGDLTLSPSILCQLGNVANEPCGFHGWVRDGKWVTA